MEESTGNTIYHLVTDIKYAYSFVFQLTVQKVYGTTIEWEKIVEKTRKENELTQIETNEEDSSKEDKRKFCRR